MLRWMSLVSPFPYCRPFLALKHLCLLELIQNKNQAVRRSSPIRRPLSHEVTGSIEYTIGFYAKVAPGSEDGSPDIKKSLLESDAFKKARKDAISDVEAAVMVTKPPVKWPSGILSMQVCVSILWIRFRRRPKLTFVRTDTRNTRAWGEQGWTFACETNLFCECWWRSRR